LGCAPERIGNMATLVIAAFFTVAKIRKEPRCLLTDEWVNKMWYIHTKEYYSAPKRKEILTLATTQMTLEDILLSETSKSQKDNTCTYVR
jgi:hypothetical protein